MKGTLDFVKTTAVGGFFVVLPVALVLFLFGKAVAALVMFVAPLLGDLTLRQIGGVGVGTLLAVLLVFLLCFATGLLVRTHLGRLSGNWLELRLLGRLPGYRMLKNLTRRFSGEEGTEFAPALVDLYGGESRALALIVEELDNGMLTVFLPLAPTPTLGQLHLVRPEKVTRLQAPMGAVLNSIMQWGVDSKKLFQAP